MSFFQYWHRILLIDIDYHKLVPRGFNCYTCHIHIKNLFFLQTQPVPNPVSYFMHQSPEIFHKFETLMNHFVELVVPFFILLTRPFRIWCGILQILFQVSLLLSFFLYWIWESLLNCFGQILVTVSVACTYRKSSFFSQVILIISGNLSFLNWLTILPSLMCFDDKSLAFLFSSSSAKKEVIKIQQLQNTGAPESRPTWGI